VRTLKETTGPFDLIFLDIEKKDYPAALPVIEEKLRPGGVLIVDNMVWSGRVYQPAEQGDDTKGVRELTRALTKNPRWIVSLIPIRDGLMVGVRV